MVAIFLVILLVILFVATRDPGGTDEPSLVRIEAYRESAGTFDSDGDGVPDWLEEVVGSDTENPSSFPYQRDIMLAKSVTASDLIYEGPGELVKDIVRRVLLGVDDIQSLTEEERTRFVNDSSEYFLKKLSEQEVPDVNLRIDDDVSRSEVLDGFLRAIGETQYFERPINEYIEEIFAKNVTVMQEAFRSREHCDSALETFPRAVPSEVFPYYFVVIERVTFLCEALSVALSSNRSEDYFLVIFLMNAGALFDPPPEGETVDARVAVANERLQNAMMKVHALLSEDGT